MRALVTVLVLMLVVGPSMAAEVKDACWDEWRAKSLKCIPRPDDTVHPCTGKPLSQTPPAERTRALKFQAAEDAMALRGKESPAWQTFREECITR